LFGPGHDDDVRGAGRKRKDSLEMKVSQVKTEATKPKGKPQPIGNAPFFRIYLPFISNSFNFSPLPQQKKPPKVSAFVFHLSSV
jgi:hypothetical protein